MMILAQIALPPKAIDYFVIASVLLAITWEPTQAVSNTRGIWQFVAWEEPSPSNPDPRGTWQFVDWKPPCILGVFGLVLLLLALVLQGVQPVIDIFNIK